MTCLRSDSEKREVGVVVARTWTGGDRAGCRPGQLGSEGYPAHRAGPCIRTKYIICFVKKNCAASFAGFEVDCVVIILVNSFLLSLIFSWCFAGSYVS